MGIEQRADALVMRDRYAAVFSHDFPVAARRAAKEH